jgi:hypothetical protein
MQDYIDTDLTIKHHLERVNLEALKKNLIVKNDLMKLEIVFNTETEYFKNLIELKRFYFLMSQNNLLPFALDFGDEE